MFSNFGLLNGQNFQFGGISRKYEDYFRCYPISMMPDNIRKDSANFGGKIFLPASALNKLTMYEIVYPMMFNIVNNNSKTSTHCGVLEFTAEEGRSYLPQWMMKTLGLEPGELVQIESCELPKGKFVKIEPQSVNFLEISDPKAVLENVLRNFTTLTVNDVISVNYNDTIYDIKVLEAKPSEGICVVETDLETDFAPPVGYVEPDYKSQVKKNGKEDNGKKTWKPVNTYGDMAKKLNYAKLMETEEKTNFKGAGSKLSGKEIKKETNSNIPIDVNKLTLDGDIKPLVLPNNQLFFGFPLTPPPEEEIKEESKETENDPFKGNGISLREATKKRKNQKPLRNSKNKVRSPGNSADNPMEIE